MQLSENKKAKERQKITNNIQTLLDNNHIHTTAIANIDRCIIKTNNESH